VDALSDPLLKLHKAVQIVTYCPANVFVGFGLILGERSLRPCREGRLAERLSRLFTLYAECFRVALEGRPEVEAVPRNIALQSLVFVVVGRVVHP
jgi:hypothetical protein